MKACQKIVRAGASVALAAVLMMEGATAQDLRPSFDMAVPVVPAPVALEGRRQYAYELHLTNFSADPLRIRELSVLDAETGETLTRFAGERLAARLSHVATGRDAEAIAPGERAILYIEFERDRGALPRRLSHRADYTLAGPGAPKAFGVFGADIAIDMRPIPILGPPLSGGPWVAIHHPDWVRGHRRMVYAVGGKARIPGRFAIDWIKADMTGRTTSGDADAVSATLGYGADVIAVADAVVAGVRDDMSESDRISANPRHPIGDAAGNFVSLALPGGRYAIYEHLKPGSIRVKPGDPVRKGAIIASLGFTGDSTGPHLHFHVADAAEPLQGEGMPFLIDRFMALGRYGDIGRLGSSPWDAALLEDGDARTAERPGSNMVVMFRSRARD
ncbi:M23 family metallopeptidase [Sphingomonas colocasiae]|uniref:M23 family metallopeptidase n=1 Tax=Sphingomonas colocasiae TaxID=1848973 RepID=A0ABS7PIX3_9SPHN|nr:M23 family metallopeptidase [Sphingomonas colocasiae]MBY8820909.1 M23 family metallopeptidase [Sphingomonas colocasiae]